MTIGGEGILRSYALALSLAIACSCSDEGSSERESEDAHEADILFASDRGGVAAIYAVSSSGGEAELVAGGASAKYPAAGGAVAIAASGPEGHRRERLMLLGGRSGPQALTPPSTRARNPSLAPGGAWVAFESDHESFRDIYRIEIETGAVARLTSNPEGNFEPAISPDGSSIAFASSRDGNAEIYVMAADGSDERRLTAFHRDDWSPRWSPSGESIAFLSDREGGSHIFLMDPDGTGQRKLDASAGHDEHASEIRWSPDGRSIAYARRRGTSAPEIWTLDIESGKRLRLTPPGLSGANPSWSPDGDALVFAGSRRRQGDLDIYLVARDGSNLERLTSASADDWLPMWRPSSASSATFE